MRSRTGSRWCSAPTSTTPPCTKIRSRILPVATASGGTRLLAPTRVSTSGCRVPGKTLLIPGMRILPDVPQEGIVINLPEHRLYYFPKVKKGQKRTVITYPVSIGKMDWKTPLGVTRIVNKQKNPSWYPPESVRKEHAANGEKLPAVVGPGPDNPLGAYAMRLSDHAWRVPDSRHEQLRWPLAWRVTHGCMRMYPEDIEALFPQVPVGTPVRIINEPVKTAFVNGELLLEAHPPVDAEGQSV